MAKNSQKARESAIEKVYKFRKIKFKGEKETK